MTDGEFYRSVLAFLKRWRTASLATVDQDGVPCAANVQYVCDEDLNLYFISSEESAHSLNLALEPRVAMTIYAHVDDEHSPDAGVLHGLQLQGDCSVLHTVHDREAALMRYMERFAFIQSNPVIAARVEKETMYRVTPYWMRYIDNRRGFGWKMEMEF